VQHADTPVRYPPFLHAMYRRLITLQEMMARMMANLDILCGTVHRIGATTTASLEVGGNVQNADALVRCFPSHA